MSLWLNLASIAMRRTAAHVARTTGDMLLLHQGFSSRRTKSRPTRYGIAQ
jgi:hypothetical protein